MKETKTYLFKVMIKGLIIYLRLYLTRFGLCMAVSALLLEGITVVAY